MLPGPQSIHDAHGDTAHYTWPTTHVNIELFVSYFSWVLVLVLVLVSTPPSNDSLSRDRFMCINVNF